MLALSFAVLGLVPVRPFRELAFLMSVGPLVDAFVVRTLLVPSLISIVGPVSAWPGRLRTVPPAAPTAEGPRRAPPSVGAARPSRVLLGLVAIGVAISALRSLRMGRRPR